MLSVAVPVATVHVDHGLASDAVIVHAYDPTGEEVEVGISIINANQVVLTTVPELPFSGTVVVVAGDTAA